jgi:hypothetical protein
MSAHGLQISDRYGLLEAVMTLHDHSRMLTKRFHPVETRDAMVANRR